jgi:hypothetical protein
VGLLSKLLRHVKLHNMEYTCTSSYTGSKQVGYLALTTYWLVGIPEVSLVL